MDGSRELDLDAINCCIHGEYDVTIVIVPKRGTWSCRDVYEVCELAQEYQSLADIGMVREVEGGFQFQGTRESTIRWHMNIGAFQGIYGVQNAEAMFERDGRVLPMQIRTYGISGPMAQDWRTLPTSPDFDKVCCYRYMDKMIHLRAKFCVPLRKVVDLYHVLTRLGHHVVRTEGFAVNADGGVKLRKRKVYILSAERRRIQKSLGVEARE